MPFIDLDQELTLGTADRYTSPHDAGAVLPRVYGDFASPLAMPNDHADGGLLPAVCINRLTWDFLLNDGPTAATWGAPRIYYNDTLQSSIVYDWFPAADYASRGQIISYVHFHQNPMAGTISWRGAGTVNPSSGALMTNPIDALAEVFGIYGGWTANDIDPPSVARTKADMAALGDTLHWCFHEQRSFRHWLTEILRHFHTDYWENVDGRLHLSLDRSVTTLPVSVFYTVDADAELVGPAIEAVDYEEDDENLINQVTVGWRRKWTTGEYTDHPTVTYVQGTRQVGLRKREFELPATYTEAQGLRWLRGMLIRYGQKPATVSFRMRGLSLLSALPGTFLGFIWRERGWHPEAPRLLKVLDMSPDIWGQEISFRCFDCQRQVTDALTLPVLPIAQKRHRITSVSTHADITPPGPASGLTATGSYRRIVLRWTAPGDFDYDHTEVWAAVVNNRASATMVRAAGRLAPGQTNRVCEELFDVGDNETYFVWLMTVDTSGNGKDGTGNWFPASATAGVLATSSLVPTQGIREGAVNERHTGFLTLTPGIYVGERQVALASLGGFFLTGNVDIKGRVSVIIGSLHTLVIKIYRGGVGGAVVGSEYQTNPLNVPVAVDKFCPGDESDPSWTGTYTMTIQSIAQDGTQQAYHVFSARLDLFHSKR